MMAEARYKVIGCGCAKRAGCNRNMPTRMYTSEYVTLIPYRDLEASEEFCRYLASDNC